MRTSTSFLRVLIGLCVAGTASMIEAQTTAPAASTEHVWDLTHYLHGTTTQVRDALNQQCEQLIGRQQQLEHTRSSLESHIREEHQACLDRVHHSPAYHRLVRERDEAQQALTEARHGTDPYAKLDASSHYTKAEAAVKAYPAAALANDSDLANAQQRLAKVNDELHQVKPALADALAWRQKLLDAMRQTFRMHGPITTGSQGILAQVTPLKVYKHGILIQYEAPEYLGEDDTAGNQEGIVTYKVLVRKVYLLVGGLDTSSMAENHPVTLDQNFTVTRSYFDDKLGMMYVATPSPADTDELFKAILPLHPVPAK